MEDIVLEIIEQIFGNEIVIPACVCILAIWGVYKLWKCDLPKYIKVGLSFTTISVAGVVVSSIFPWSNYYGILNGREIGIGLFLIVTAITTVFTIRRYWITSRNLHIALKNSESESDDLVLSWNELQSIKASDLTKRQLRKYDRRRMYLRIILGNLKGAEFDLETYKASDPELYHFLRAIIFYYRGKHQQEAEEIKLAEDFCNGDTDPILRVQITTNRGVAYIGLGEYGLADDQFTRAISLGNEYGVTDSKLWHIIYFNYVFNKTRITPDITFQKCLDLLEGVKEHIDIENPNDYSAYCNSVLTFLRQTNAPRDVIDEYVNQNFSYLIGNDKLSIQKKCALEASVARLVCCGRLNPDMVIEQLSFDREIFLKLPMPHRYRCLKEIDFMFSDLRGSIVEQNELLKETVHWYMINQASHDLEDYKSSLPAEAVYEKCYCIKEIAGLLKRDKNRYKWNLFLETMNTAQLLYRENELPLESAMCMLDILDEAIAPVNLNQDIRSLYIEDMRRYLSEIEDFLPELEKHPVLNEIFLRLCTYSFAMNEYDKCRNYYMQYRELGNYSIQHFAPWLQGKYAVMSIIVFVLEYINAVDSISGFDLSTESDQVKSWFKEFHNRNGFFEALVLGRLWGGNLIPLAVEFMTPTSEHISLIRYNEIKKVWLVIPSINFKILANGKDDEIFSEYRREKDGYLRFSLIDSLGYESVSAVNRIVELIDQELPEFLPKSSELNQFVEDSCFNVAVQLDTDGVTIQS